MVNLKAILLWRKFARKFNSKGIFWEMNPKPFPILIISGYTRSGTTYLGKILSSILKARYLNEPLNPTIVKEIAFFHPREAAKIILNNERHIDALKFVFGPNFKCNNDAIDQGHGFFYKDRIIKIIRANFYLDFLSKILSEAKFCIIIRNPASAIASRIKKGWDIPDHSKCLIDILPELTLEQRATIKELESIYEKLALSWCLDNFMALKNLSNKNFKFIFYEHLILDPFIQIKQIIEFMGKKVPDKKIIHEIKIYNLDAPRKTEQLIKGWEGVLKEEQLGEIIKIVDVFSLSHLYDFYKGLPKVQNLQ